MNAESCAVLSAVFPLVLLALLSERRNLHLNLRKTRLFRETFAYGAAISILGLIVVVVGVQLGGLRDGWGLMAWIMAGLTAVALIVLAGGLIATAEVEEEKGSKGKKGKQKTAA